MVSKSHFSIWKFFTKFYNLRSVLDIVTLYLELVLFLFVALPFVFKYTPYIQRNMVFLPFVRLVKLSQTFCRVNPAVFPPDGLELWILTTPRVAVISL